MSTFKSQHNEFAMAAIYLMTLSLSTPKFKISITFPEVIQRNGRAYLYSIIEDQAKVLIAWDHMNQELCVWHSELHEGWNQDLSLIENAEELEPVRFSGVNIKALDLYLKDGQVLTD